MPAKARAKKAKPQDDRKKLARFFIQLSRDPRLRERFSRNPKSTMDKAGLSKKHKAVVHSGDPKKIRKSLGSAGPPGCFILLISRR